MKSAINFSRSIASTVLCLAAFASASFAAKTHPLNQPDGLAVNSKGDLYVANEGANQILVYSPTYSQIPSKTITQDINSPFAVAFDPQGDLWVANVVPSRAGVDYLSEYSPAGKQINAAVSQEYSEYDAPILAVDGAGNIWVAGMQGFMHVRSTPSPYSSGQSVQFYGLAGAYTAAAAQGPWVAFGTPSSATWQLAGPTLTGASNSGFFGSGETVPDGVAAMTFDANCMLYVAAPNGLGEVSIQFHQCSRRYSGGH